MSNRAHDALHEPYQPEEKKFPASHFPHFSVMQPVFDQIVDPFATEKPEANVTGIILATLALDHFFADLIPEGTKPMHVCMVSTLGKDTWCYSIEGRKVSIVFRSCKLFPFSQTNALKGDPLRSKRRRQAACDRQCRSHRNRSYPL